MPARSGYELSSSTLPVNASTTIFTTMKISTLIVLVIALVHGSMHAQNLVINPSFEEFSECPNAFGLMNNAIGWISSKSSPDYMHSCTNGIGPNSVPYFSTAFQYPATGSAFAGLLTYGGFGSNPALNFREYITGTLTQPLIIGTQYFVSLKTVRMDRAPFATNNLGFNFVTVPSVDFPISNVAHVYSSTVLTDTVNWTMIFGSFIAESMYTHFVLGNHFTDALTTIVSIPSTVNTSHGYYLIDDVCVSMYGPDCGIFTGTPEVSDRDLVNISPNPFDQYISITSAPNKSSEIVIYDFASRIMKREVFWGNTMLETSDLDQGVYLYMLRSGSNILAQGKLIKR